MEAQYGLQKKKPFIPLKLVHGYEADGWLGLMLGTSMWYAFYGETLSSESAFETRMASLSREIGVCGRADAVVAASMETASGDVTLVSDDICQKEDPDQSTTSDGMNYELNAS